MPSLSLFFCLIALPFLSKMSFRWLGILPEKVSIFWMQGGIHPVMNSILSVGLILYASRQWKNPRRTFAPSEKVLFTLLMGLCLILWTQAVLQWAFLDLNVPTWMHFTGVALTSFLILGYGWFLPQQDRVPQLFRCLTLLTRACFLLSFALLAIHPGLAFKGSRFIGVFKHIPYMVTCGQLGLLVECDNLRRRNLNEKFVAACFLILAIASLVLTGTRSATLCGIVFLGLALWKWPLAKSATIWVRRGVVYLTLIFMMTLGPFAASELNSFMRGESSFGLRTAQDGVASRAEEIERGTEIFHQEPILGHGLLYRFGSESVESAGSYDSFRDPHNIILSAGVIGGWPLAVLISLGLVSLGLAAIYKLVKLDSSEDHFQRNLIAAYLLSHLPILFVYHMHFSLGGLADRIYWLFLGCLLTHPVVKKGFQWKPS